MTREDFWQDAKAAQIIINEIKKHKDILETFRTIDTGCQDGLLMLELIAAEDNEDNQLAELSTEALALEAQLESFELRLVLSEPHDQASAILELHPGAGGVESQDWAEMLMRMYLRWAEKNNYRTEILDYLAGEEAGLKSVTILIKGENVYGYLKAEKGVHRLVRISPFDSSGRRHTSFASVHVMPEIEDDIDLVVKEEDLKIDTYRASGAGGQHINTTDSAVRITHLPTNTIVTCQQERSQIKNRERAMKILHARLHAKKIEEKQQELQVLSGEQMEIGWGSQIRSYVFHPYKMVKDHRTQIEISNTQAVMDGEIKAFIDGYLRLGVRN